MAAHDLSFVGLHSIVCDLVCYLIVYNVWWQIVKIYTANCRLMLSFYSQRSFVFCPMFALVEYFQLRKKCKGINLLKVST